MYTEKAREKRAKAKEAIVKEYIRRVKEAPQGKKYDEKIRLMRDINTGEYDDFIKLLANKPKLPTIESWYGVYKKKRDYRDLMDHYGKSKGKSLIPVVHQEIVIDSIRSHTKSDKIGDIINTAYKKLKEHDLSPNFSESTLRRFINKHRKESPSILDRERDKSDDLKAIKSKVEELEKAIQAQPEPPELEQVQIPLYQHAVSAGPACTVSEEVEEYMPVPKKIARHPRNTFAVRVSGDSMIGAGIEEGDIIICDARGTYKTGSIVVASIDGGQTLKKIQMDKGAVTLKPANHNHDTIPITDNSDLSILGVVIAIFRILEQL